MTITTKRFKLKDLDCANCAAKMEAAISKLEGVEACTISFMTQRMTLTAMDDKFDALLAQAQDCIHKVDPHCDILK